jgi:hypothetical protein
LENRRESSIDAKYAKYSTEQLEVILTHLSDPDDQELVKKELSRRYYNHYLSLGSAPGDKPQAARVSGPEAATDGTEEAGEDLPATGAPSGAYPALAEEVAGIEELEPPRLTPPPLAAGADQAEKTGEPATKKKLCFIATAAYGTPLAPEIVVLQRFRDDYLAPQALGEQCLRAYYRFSPYLANQISRQPILRRLTRMFLTPLIGLIKKTFDYSAKA